MTSCKRLHKALLEYAVNLDALRAANAILRTNGLELYNDGEIGASLERVTYWIRTSERGEMSERDLDRLSDELDATKLGTFSWEDAVENSKGAVVKTFELSEKLRDRVIDLVQK